MTSLPEYLKAQNETQTAFAGRSGLSDSTLSRVLAGKIPPSHDVIQRVYVATEGRVDESDLYAAWRAAQASTATASADRAVGEVAS
ncbi:helix-turn-helix domain-containing protein [Reyranella sp.]|uniref:helix-turn-helix domain-containing protein n=1 Tax=Reyranella sp. TaxID=1929291 RepID=UPI003C7D9B21